MFAPQTPLLPAALMSAAFLLPAACGDEGTALAAPHARAPEPSGASCSVGGLTVHNPTNEARIPQHVVAADFTQARIHANGNTGTAPGSPSPVIVEAGQSAELPPHGAALRLEEPNRSFRTGDGTLLALHFDDSPVVFANAKILSLSPPRPGSDP